MSSPLARFDVPPEKRAAIAALSRVPRVSPAVLGLLVASTGGVIAADVLALLGYINLWWACLVNCFLMYWQFTVVHDSIHRSAAKNQKLNDWLGHIGIATFAPHVNLGLFRWAHVQHHRYTNGPKDPDTWLHGTCWSMPFRWMFLDLGYLRFVFRHGDATARRHLRGAMVHTALIVVAVIALTFLGYGKELLLLWFIPSRVTFATVGFVFFWLPHVKG